MRSLSPIVALFLLAGMAAFWLSLPVWAQPRFSLDNPSHSPTHPAGCHEHSNKSPSSTPVSYRCCIAGHDRAITSSAFSGVAPLTLVDRANEANLAPPSFAQSIPGTMIPASPSPPGLTPLRI